MLTVDLNCDMGEGYPYDADLMEHVTSVNVACGSHAGDSITMRRTVELALGRSVAIGAHPSYPDRENFGRLSMALPPQEAFEIVSEQVYRLWEICLTSGASLHHVKPHGALYNQTAKDGELAAAIAGAVAAIDPQLILYGLSGSFLIGEAEGAGLRSASEVFADRTYRADGSLTPRTEPDALITDRSQAVAQALQMVTSRSVTATSGEAVAIKPDTICIHGDGEQALEFAKAIRHELEAGGISIKAP